MSLQLIDSPPPQNPAWCSIFNSKQFYTLHKTDNSTYLQFIFKDKLVAVCHFTEIEPGMYRSPYRGTFGGIDFSEDLDLSVKSQCIALLDEYFIKKSAVKVMVISAPLGHGLHNSTAILNTLLNHGFHIVNQEVNHTLPVIDSNMIERMKHNNRKRLNKCDREGFVFQKVESSDGFAKVYSVIQVNRESKGFSISMTFEEILNMYQAFPDQLFFFKSTQLGIDAAAAICIKINESILYVFYWADLPGYEQYSPVVHLANGIYEFARQNTFNLIDAGTSSIYGQPNYGVATFKENLGFRASPKFTYAKTYR